jgi:hypothetical protein
LIYAAGWTDRRTEMLEHAKYAADHNVLEARALWLWFMRGNLGPAPDMEALAHYWIDTIQLVYEPDLISGAPGTVSFESRDEALRVIFSIAATGSCGEPRDIAPESVPRPSDR